MSIGKRIIELRKSANMTQAELADKLAVTDKAVSKWERDIGEPNTQSLIEISKIFNVSLDYLLTGQKNKEEPKMSDVERMAYEDDVEAFNNKYKNYGYGWLSYAIDNNRKTLVDYIYKHNALNIFARMCEDRNMAMYILGSNYKYLYEFIKMSLEIRNYKWMGDNSSQSQNVQPLFDLTQVQIIKKNGPVNKYGENNNLGINEKIIDFIYEREDILEYLIKNRPNYWGNAIAAVLERMVKNKHPKTEELLKFIEENTNETLEFYKQKQLNRDEYYEYSRFIYGIRQNTNKRIIKSFTPVTRETVLYALDNNEYELAERLNKLSGGQVSEHEIKMDKVNKDRNMTNKDKLRESVTFEGIVDIDKLIALDDYDLYEETIKLPVSEKEYALKLTNEKKYRELFSYAIKNNLNHIIDCFRKNEINDLEKAINIDFQNKKIVINQKYLETRNYRRNHQNVSAIIGKNCILFEDIKNHKDYRFFEHAAKTDLYNLDDALEYVVINRPTEYRLMKILLDRGAQLIHRYTEDDGGGDYVTREEIDKTATQLLKNQVEIFLKGNNEK